MINRNEPVSQMGMKVQNVTWFVILNLFQDLKLLRVRRSRNEFGMTGRKERESVFSIELAERRKDNGQ